MVLALRERRSLSALRFCMAIDSTFQTEPAWLRIAFSMYISFLCFFVLSNVKPFKRAECSHVFPLNGSVDVTSPKMCLLFTHDLAEVGKTACSPYSWRLSLSIVKDFDRDKSGKFVY